MRIAILVAMDKELSLLLHAMPEYKEEKIGENIYYRGEIGSKEVIAGKCGIGKVNSALRTAALLREVKPDLVLNSGVAGGADASMSVGSVLIADKVAYHDVWCGPGTEYGAADGMPVYLMPDPESLDEAKRIFSDTDGIRYGLICSGDKFIHLAEEVKEIKGHFPEALAVDMESASIGQTCIMAGVPFLIVRVMSDTPGSGDNLSQYKNFWGEAPSKTFDCVRRLIENHK